MRQEKPAIDSLEIKLLGSRAYLSSWWGMPEDIEFIVMYDQA